MDTSVQEFDGATQTWITPEADPVVETPAAEPDEPAADAAPVEPVADVKKPRNDPKARMLDATAKEAAAKRERDEAKAENSRLAARLAELEARSTPKPAPRIEAPAADAEPTVDQFDSYEKFVDARSRWAAGQEFDRREKARSDAQQKHQFERAQDQIEDQFFGRWNAAKGKDPELPNRIEQNRPGLLNTPRIERLAANAVPTFDNFLVSRAFVSKRPEEMLEYASRPDVYQRLATLHPIDVIEELARFNHSDGAASPTGSAPKAPAISHAKPPIKPVGSSPLVTTDEPSEEDSDDEWLRKENAKTLRLRRAGRG